jgi:ADP-heptose:LPS heptosyltransferase
MGDCLLLTSPVRALKQQFPGFSISVLVEARFAACFSRNPDIAEIIVARNKFQTAARLVTRRFDIVINLHGGPTSGIYARLARGLRIGREHYQHRMLYDALAPGPELSAHTVESTMALFHWLGLRAGAVPALRFEIHSLEAARIRAKVPDSYAVIHPAAVLETKRWPAARFSELARRLSAHGLKIVVTAGPGEEACAIQVAESIDGAAVLLGLSIAELAELIRAARLYVGNDSGPLHLAAAVGTPSVAVWGSSESRRWHPWKVTHRVVQNPFECNPCPGYRCLVADSPLCIESVSVDQVAAAAEELLTR